MKCYVRQEVGLSRDEEGVRREEEEEDSCRSNSLTKGEECPDDVCRIRALYPPNIGFGS